MKGILIASIVVPAISETINLSSFINLFINVDFPALGLPRTAIFFPSGDSYFSFGRESLMYVRRSLMFLECSALISKKSLIPFLCKSTLSRESEFLSILLRTVIKFLLSFLSLVRISKSSLFKFSEPSRRKIIRLDSSAAIQACSAMSSLRIVSS